MARVITIGGTRSHTTPAAFTAPTSAHSARAAAMPLSPPPVPEATLAQTTADRATTPDTDRSMPLMITTRVWPTATMPRNDAVCTR